MVNERDSVPRVLDVIRVAGRPLTISAISREAGIDRHTVSHILEILRLRGQVLYLHQGMAKKYYIQESPSHISFPSAPADLIIIVDQALNLFYVNETAAGYLKTPAKNLAGKKLDSLSHPVLHHPEFFIHLLKTSSQKVVHVMITISRDDGSSVYPVTITTIGIPDKGHGILIIIEEACVDDGAKVPLNHELIPQLSPGIIVANLEGEILHANPSFLLSTGYPDESDILGHTITDIIGEDPYLIDSLVHLGTYHAHFQERIVTKRDGSQIFCLMHWELIRSPSDIPLYVTGIMLDISGRGELTEKIATLEGRFRDIVEGISDVIWETGADFRYTYISPAITAMTGYNPDELIGAPPLWLSYQGSGEASRKIFSEASTDGSDILSREHILEHKDGHRVVIETRAIPLLSPNGEFRGYRGIDRNITGRKRAEEALLQEKNYSDKLFDAPRDTVFLFEPSTGKPIRWNKTFTGVSGYTDDEIAGMNAPYDFYDEADLKTATDAMGRNYAEDVTVELSLVTKQGAHIPFEYSATPIETADGGMLVLSIGRDITERKQADAALLATLKRIQEQQAALALISFSPAILSGDLDEFSTNLTEESAGVLGVERASVWIFDKMGDELKCIDLFLASHDRHSRDLVLKRYEYINEFDALSTAKFIDANDPLTDPRTAGYVEGYLKPNHITSMLDAVIRVSGQNLGVLCFEHVDRPHHWEADEIAFACQLADQIAITLLNRDRKQAEETLRESEGKLNAMLQSVADSMSMMDADLNIIWANETAKQYFGNDLTGRKCYEAYHHRQNPCEPYPCITLRAFQDGKIHRHETTVIDTQGQTHFFECSANVALNDERGKPMAVLEVSRDITEQKIAGEALRESEARFRSIIHSMQFGVVVIDAHTHSILDANGKALEMIGGNNDVIVGTVCNRFICPAECGKCPITDLGQMIDSSERILMTLQGERIPILKSVIKTSLGGKDVLIESFVDITERKLAEEALHESQQRFQGLVETVYDWVWEVDHQGRYTYVSPRVKDLLGYEPEELLGKTPFDIRPQEQAQNISEIFGLLSAEQKPLSALENINLHKDGHEVIMETNGLPFYDARGTFKGYHGTDRDITKRKNLEKEMQYHEQVLMEFSTSIAAANKKLNLLSSITRHDINNQLMVQMGYLSMLEEKQTDVMHNECFLKVLTAAKRISAMIQFTKEYEEIGVHAPRWQDYRTIVDSATKDAHLGKILVKNDLLTGMEVFADPLIVKVFYNLIDNAVRYGGKITTIRFSDAVSGDDHLIVCEDDGNGVPADEKKKIFKRGFGKNTGMGLALAREILDITGITITETGVLGRGARFEMIVPKGMYRMNPGSYHRPDGNE